MSNFSDMEETTREFFDRHRPSSRNFGRSPIWRRWDSFLRGPVPNYMLGGCYALFEGGDLIYIGKGVGKGRGPTPYHGISRHLSSHVLRIDNYTEEKGEHISKLTDKWKNVDAIYTIGFANEIEYLAHALENFLIRKLSPPKNSHL